jgi:hypothetical protein
MPLRCEQHRPHRAEKLAVPVTRHALADDGAVAHVNLLIAANQGCGAIARWPRPRRMRLRCSMSSSRPGAVKYDKAVKCLVKDRDALLAFYDFPAEHWKHLRTTNVIESSFATVRHRTVRSKGCLSNKTALAMIFKLASSRWSQPVAETHPRCKVHRRDRTRQIASSSRCRLTPSVTKIRR